MTVTNFELIRFTENNHGEQLAGVERERRLISFFVAPRTTKVAVSDDDFLINSWIEMEGNVTALWLISQIHRKSANNAHRLTVAHSHSLIQCTLRKTYCCSYWSNEIWHWNSGRPMCVATVEILMLAQRQAWKASHKSQCRLNMLYLWSNRMSLYN